MTDVRPRRTRTVLALTLAASVSLGGQAFAMQPRESSPMSEYEPAESLEGNFLSAYIAGASRDTAAAASFYREAVKADPRNTDLLERAFVSLLADGALPDAFRAAERLVNRDSTNGLAQLSLGVRQIKAGQWAAARQNFSRSGRGAAADLTATLLTAWAYAGAGDGKRALETVSKLKGERYYNTFRDYHAGLIASVTGDQAEAERRLKAAYDADKNTLRIVDAYARFEANAGRTDLAIQAYTDFDALMPRHPIVRDALDKLKAGKPLARLVTTAQEGAGEVLYGLGSAGSTQGDELPAVVYLRLALYLAPEHALARLTLADTLDRMKQPEKANEAYAQIPATSPLKLNADIQIGLNLEQAGKGDEALQYLDAAMKAHPDDIDVITALGNVQRSRKKYEEAAETYSRAIALIGDRPQANFWTTYYFRGTAYERAKQWPKAEADLKKALELVPASQPAAKAQVLNYLGYSWVDQKINIDDAFKLLKQAADASPRDGMIVDSLGWAYFRLGRWDDAVRELEKAVELKPGDPTINDHLGDAYWRSGRRLEGKFQWQHAKDLNPEPDDLVQINEKLKNGLPDTDKPTATAENPPAPVAAPHNAENPELPKGAPAPSEAPGSADKKSGG
ncbi:tetratricopeptide repeat protein [Methylobacterium sp. E-041]|jgi:tetratricopeptide (TPR) repeat protein|uniref:tetratricopeptide repeat protein n=2 Tax=Pseudomonadota TaxID=1224 RepID=UPI0011CBD6DB|nr:MULTISPECIES: tetratricopeptide repeat protein [unclassified Methylobacterium]MCJ2041757.1 tetratricopeptide repeat protein [Methylobacterium sp. J-059]MCJ2106589.1 tetratricopeptide repeat protein [Methylobacterium sp. E-041]MCJ2113053.1 tetratricopeptide repeat protein [Methylobacterium sp. E-025]TXN72798.1 tetratricopeptide repeat protein [Methylobacterium sp. WL6]